MTTFITHWPSVAVGHASPNQPPWDQAGETVEVTTETTLELVFELDVETVLFELDLTGVIVLVTVTVPVSVV